MIRGMQMRISFLTRGLILTSAWVAAFAGQNQSVPLKVAAVQFRSSYNVADNLKRMDADLIKLADDHVRVAVFPECALTGYNEDAVKSATQDEVASAEEHIRNTCRQHGIAAVFGSVYKVNGKIYNSAVVFDSHGELIERYAKIHLAGEKWFTPGNHISYFELEGIPST